MKKSEKRITNFIGIQGSLILGITVERFDWIFIALAIFYLARYSCLTFKK